MVYRRNIWVNLKDPEMDDKNYADVYLVCYDEEIGLWTAMVGEVYPPPGESHDWKEGELVLLYLDENDTWRQFVIVQDET